jgi:hypothetical protein
LGGALGEPLGDGPVSACKECRALEALKSSTSDESLKTDCAVLLRRHPEHGAYPHSVTEALRTLQGGAQERAPLSVRVAEANRRSRGAL